MTFLFIQETKMIFFILVVALVLAAAFAYREASQGYLVPLSYKPPQICPVSFKAANMKPCKVDADCSECLNSFCQEIPPTAVYSLNNKDQARLPKGKFCLPQKINNLNCNPYTSIPVLSKDPALKKFVWRCQCKYPAMINNAGVMGDCTNVKACAPGKLVCPPSANPNDTDPSKRCTPGAVWDGSWDPIHGVCSCPAGFFALNNDPLQKLCKRDKCYPGKTSSSGLCDCSERKTKDSLGNWTSYMANPTENACLYDTCNPLGYLEGGRCVCNKGAVPVIRPDGKKVCVSPCGDGTAATNPCAKRGICVVEDNQPYGRYMCVSCRFPYYQDDTFRCKNIVKPTGSFCDADHECENKVCNRDSHSTTALWRQSSNIPNYKKCQAPSGRGFGGL